MRKISYSKFPPKCAHARILVAIFGQPTGNRLYYYFYYDIEHTTEGAVCVRVGICQMEIRENDFL